jgi:RimJ/RimL family protein N-acetyltransferase
MTYRIIPDFDGRVAQWVSDGIKKDDNEWLKERLCSFAFVDDNKLLGGLVFHNFEPQHSLWWTVYSVDKRWCNRRMLRVMFGLAFEHFKCRRINVLVDEDNEASLRLVQKLGFKIDGHLRRFRSADKDSYLLGMLKNECSWIKSAR